MKNILVIYHDIDLVILRMFEELQRSGHFQITLAAPAHTDIDTTLPRTDVAPITSKFNIKAIRTIRRAIKATLASAVFCISTSALSNTILAATGLRVRIVGYRGTQARVHRFDPTYRMALLNPRVDHIVCETADIEEYLRGYIRPGRLSTACKPYCLEWVADAVAHPVKLDGGEHALKLCYVGISEGRPHKGLTPLLQAIRLLNDRNVPVHLTVVGRASQTDIDSAPANVTFTGNRPDAVRYIAGADLFMLTSTRDASPRVLREAQACGIPCLVSDIPGARDLIITDGPDRSGVLVAPGNPEAITDAVQHLLAQRSELRAMGAAGKANIARNYAMEDYVKYFSTLFDNLTENK